MWLWRAPTPSRVWMFWLGSVRPSYLELWVVNETTDGFYLATFIGDM